MKKKIEGVRKNQNIARNCLKGGVWTVFRLKGLERKEGVFFREEEDDLYPNEHYVIVSFLISLKIQNYFQ